MGPWRRKAEPQATKTCINLFINLSTICWVPLRAHRLLQALEMLWWTKIDVMDSVRSPQDPLQEWSCWECCWQMALSCQPLWGPPQVQWAASLGPFTEHPRSVTGQWGATSQQREDTRKGPEVETGVRRVRKRVKCTMARVARAGGSHHEISEAGGDRPLKTPIGQIALWILF